ncbi:VOC family protein [Candidatus Gottesmanbacteria bacterium]|nr:VOC family protein [Candidatus Gottesmanbacteria bacterium]
MIKAYGIAHTTLSVSNLKRTKKFYEDLFDTKIDQDNEWSFSLLKVGIPCWFSQWGKQYKNDRFDERRVGLDHIAFKLETLEELQVIISRLKKMGIKTKGLERFAGKYPYVCFRDPDNIQTEFFIPKEKKPT